MKVIKAFFKALQNCLCRTHTKLGQFSQEPDISDFALNLDHITVLVKLVKLSLQQLNQLVAQVFEVLGYYCCKPRIERDQSHLRAGHFKENLGSPLSETFDCVERDSSE